jgi:hypothetical protein
MLWHGTAPASGQAVRVAIALSVPPPIGAAFDATVMAATPIEGMGEAGAGRGTLSKN